MINDSRNLINSHSGNILTTEESEKLKDRLSKALSSKNSNNIESCNLHADCEEADEYARKHGKLWAEHCNDSSCDDHQ